MDGFTVRSIEDLGAILIGVSFLFFCKFFEPIIALIIFLGACGCMVFGVFDYGLLIYGLSKRSKKDLLLNKEGLAWIWIAGLLLTLPMCALIYWCLDYPFDLIRLTVDGMYTFTGTMAYAWDTAQLLLGYLLAFVVIFAVVWVIQNSKTPNLWGA